MDRREMLAVSAAGAATLLLGRAEAKASSNKVPRPSKLNFEDKSDYCSLCVEKWKNTPYLDGFDKNQQKIVAPILEAQEEFPGILQGRASEIIQKVFLDFAPWKMVSFQPMQFAEDNVYYLQFVNTKAGVAAKWSVRDELGQIPWGELGEISLHVYSDGCESRSRKLRAVPNFSKENWVDDLASRIRNEMTREILKDIRSNIGTIADCDFRTFGYPTHSLREQYESLYIKIVEISCIIHRKTLRGGCNWMVVGSNFHQILNAGSSVLLPYSKNSVSYVGKMHNRWDIWVDPYMPKNQILMGYKGDSILDSGYFYNPHHFLMHESENLRTSYSKKLLSTGQNFYATLTCENM